MILIYKRCHSIGVKKTKIVGLSLLFILEFLKNNFIEEQLIVNGVLVFTCFLAFMRSLYIVRFG
jgi:hypothetical protein